MEKVLFVFCVMATMESISKANPVINVAHKYGYTVEIHTIVTKDDYILTTYRIPCGKHGDKPNEHPILLAHGMLGSSGSFFVLGEDSLAFLLAEQRYDVWLLNHRGTMHSRNHKNFGVGERYWDFSLHELGLYDLAENINYILHKTKKSKLLFIGHSMGCTILFILIALKPEYNDKIILAQCWSPGVFLWHFKLGIFQALSEIIDVLWDVAKFFRAYEIPAPSGMLIRSVLNTYCYISDAFYRACLLAFFSFSGDLMHYPNTTNFELILQQFPDGASTKQIIHYGQVAKSRSFRHFDYGTEENFAIYNSMTPPIYNLSEVLVPVVLISAKGDILSTAEGVKALSTVLPNIVHYQAVENDKFNHVDFIFSQEAKTLVYGKAFWFLKQYSKNVTKL